MNRVEYSTCDGGRHQNCTPDNPCWKCGTSIILVECPACGNTSAWRDGLRVKLEGCTLRCPTCHQQWRYHADPSTQRKANVFRQLFRRAGTL